MDPINLQAMGRLSAGSTRLDLPSRAWEPTGDAGFYVKHIFQDPETGESTMLMKMDPGAYASTHSHKQLEEIFVVEGDFYDDFDEYLPGQYCQRAIGAPHSAGSRNGGIVLLIYRN